MAADWQDAKEIQTPPPYLTLFYATFYRVT